jgi:hypothetical protein
MAGHVLGGQEECHHPCPAEALRAAGPRGTEAAKTQSQEATSAW